MGPDVYLAAIDHSEVAPDTDRLAARLFLTDYRKALSNANESNVNFHFVMNKCSLRALGGSYSTSSALVQKTEYSFLTKLNTLL